MSENLDNVTKNLSLSQLTCLVYCLIIFLLVITNKLVLNSAAVSSVCMSSLSQLSVRCNILYLFHSLIALSFLFILHDKTIKFVSIIHQNFKRTQKELMNLLH